MGCKNGIAVLLLGVLGVAAGAAASENTSGLAGNRGLSPIITIIIPSDVTLQTEAQSLLDYSQTLITGDELMFIMDVPYIPVQETPIVLAQAATPSTAATPQPDYLLKECQQIESTGDPRSAGRAVDPAYMLKNFLQHRDGHLVDLASIKTTLLQGTTHGKITTEVDNTGLTFYGYDPIPNYVGNDRAVFMAEFEGKVYKIVINLVVSLTVGESPLMEGEQPVCPPPKLIKVNGKPVSGSLGFDSSYSLNSILGASILSSLSVDPSLVTLNIADLPGGAIGQTTGTNITLDPTAAGNGWFIAKGARLEINYA
jgi:hypothetical protein